MDSLYGILLHYNLKVRILKEVVRNQISITSENHYNFAMSLHFLIVYDFIHNSKFCNPLPPAEVILDLWMTLGA